MKRLFLFGIVLAVYHFFIRSWHLNWGATEDEVRRPLPGDDLISQPDMAYTRAITINAPAADIWPWLVQMGYGRGNWYTYEAVDKLFPFMTQWAFEQQDYYELESYYQFETLNTTA